MPRRISAGIPDNAAVDDIDAAMNKGTDNGLSIVDMDVVDGRVVITFEAGDNIPDDTVNKLRESFDNQDYGPTLQSKYPILLRYDFVNPPRAFP